MPSKNLIEHSINVASKLGNLAEHTREATKHLFDLQSTQDLETHLHHERLLIKAAGITTDFNEGVKSFLEKREPKFN